MRAKSKWRNARRKKNADSPLTPAASGPAAADVCRFPRRSPPRPRARPRPRPRLRRASRLASSAFLCSCNRSCSSAMRARSASLLRTPLGLNLLVLDPRPDAAAAGVDVLVADGREEEDAAAVAAPSACGAEGVVVVVVVVVAGLGASASAASTASWEGVAAAAPRADPPRARLRPLAVGFGGICYRAAGCGSMRDASGRRWMRSCAWRRIRF